MELISSPIISSLKLFKPFEIMCDAFDFAIGVVLGQLFSIENQFKKNLQKGEERIGKLQVSLLRFWKSVPVEL